MKHIKLIKEFSAGALDDSENDEQVKELFNDAFRRIVDVQLRNNAVLTRHKADVPITVLCLSGNGIFSAGKDLEDSQDMRVGTFITLRRASNTK